MKKLIIKSFVTVCLGLTFFLVIAAFYSQSVNAAATISYITTSIGENETSMGINYHCSEESSYVQYSTSQSFTKDTTLTQEAVSTLWSKEVDSSDSKTGFEARYVSRVNLTNLKENTQYYYRVVAGTSTSTTYSFKTHSASSTNANILFATDIHAAEGSYSPTRPNKMMENVRNNVRNINLMVLTGDQIDRGGYKSHWDSYYSGMQIYKNIAVAAIPGNHEYYHTSGGDYVSPEFFNQFHNNPQNGATERLNSSYYFKYGNILFIMIDTINQKYLSEQKEWFRTTVENNPSQWIIVGSHANAITGGWYSHDSKWMATNWGSLFEEYQVDLLISGHEHVFIRKNLMYKNEVNSDLGVSYYVSPAAQHKQYAIKDAYKDQVDTYDNVNYKVNTITVSSSKLTVQVYSEDGTKTKNSKTGELLTFDLLPKRSATVKTQQDSTLLNALKLEYDKENDDANIKWNKIFYGNVKKVLIERTANETTTNHDTYVSSEKVVTANIGPIYRDRNYNIKVTLVKADGSTISKDFEITNVVPYNLNLELDGGILNTPEEWVSYLSGKSTKLPTPIKDGYVFDGWYNSQTFDGEKIDRIASDVTGDQTYYAKWLQTFTISYDTRGGYVDSSAQSTYTEGDAFVLLTPTKEADTFQGWYTNPEFTGEPISDITESTKGNLELYAKWASDTKTEQPKKKCGKKSALMINLLSAASLLVVCLKKKK